MPNCFSDDKKAVALQITHYLLDDNGKMYFDMGISIPGPLERELALSVKIRFMLPNRKWGYRWSLIEGVNNMPVPPVTSLAERSRIVTTYAEMASCILGRPWRWRNKKTHDDVVNSTLWRRE